MIYPATEQYIDLAHSAIENGEVIVYPTDTLYGFGVDATNTDAIQRLNRLKGRVQPLSIVLESIEQMQEYAEFDVAIHNEMSSYFPGKYTALLPAKQNELSPLVQNGSPKIGIRIPNHFFPIKLIQLWKSPSLLPVSIGMGQNR